MSYLDKLKTQKIVVLGLGVSGRACVSYLLEHDILPVAVDDDIQGAGAQKVSQQWPQLTVCQTDEAQSLILNADVLVVSPGIALTTPILVMAKAKGLLIVGDVELYAQLSAIEPNPAKVIAITGTNGKTTVTMLVTELLKSAGIKALYGGNIGVPVMDLLAQSCDVAVLELSSFQLETTTSLHSLSATVLNVVEDHMDRYDSFGEYVNSKTAIYQHSQWQVFSRQDDHTVPGIAADQQCSFGLDRPTQGNIGIDNDAIVLAQQSQLTALCPINKIKLQGRHNLLNAMAAIALVQPFNIDPQVIEQTLTTFEGLPHRCERVADTGLVTWINDSKATNVGATVAALSSLKPLYKGQMILLAGGVGKDADFGQLQQALNSHVDQLITFGRDGEQIAALVDGAIQVSGLQQAVARANTLANDGDCVLLSPACASLDMFDNYIQRGELFKTLAQEVTDES